MVQAVLDGSRSPPEIAYAIGETIRNYFRTRGLALTGLELRRLVAELFDRHWPPSSLVAFARESVCDNPWTGSEATKSSPALPERIFGGRPSRLVRFDLSELYGLGLIDRLWADRSVEAVFVNAFDAIWIERSGRGQGRGRIERARETFRDQAHLLELVSRLARPTPSGVVHIRLRDGSEGTVVFPPAVPAGPTLVLRRGQPGHATFDRLVAAEMLSWPMADLLRLAVRSRLNILVIGPERSGKTAMLAAILRDLGDSRRIVTLSRHRAFNWPSVAKIELVASNGAKDPRFAALAETIPLLQPDVVVLDSAEQEDAAALAALLSWSGRGVVAALVPEAASSAVTAKADLLVQLGRASDGLFRAVALSDSGGTPIFAFDGTGFRCCT